MQRVAAHMKRAQPTEEGQPTLPFLKDGSCVEGPVKLVIQMDTQLPVTGHQLAGRRGDLDLQESPMIIFFVLVLDVAGLGVCKV